MLNIIDLTHTISPNMPVYPGTEPPFISATSSIGEDGFLEKKITMYSHTGTHMDAPAHIIKLGKTLDLLPVEHFAGKARVIHQALLEKQTIDSSDLEPYQDLLKETEFILLQTAWSKFWGTEDYFAGYPVLSPEAALWLSDFGLKGIGIDAPSFDKADSDDLAIHRIFLRNDVVLIENLTNLNALPDKTFMFSCFPLKMEQAEGSPVRATAFIG